MKGSNPTPALARALALAQIFELLNRRMGLSKVARPSPAWYLSEFTRTRGFQKSFVHSKFGQGQGQGQGEITTQHLGETCLVE